jgi:hypothetical protein
MKRLVCLAVALTVVLLLPACGTQKKAAETAISGAETAYNGIKDQAMSVAPDSAKIIEDAIAAAKADVEKGDFKAALEASKDLPAQVQALGAGLAAKQAELQTAWEALNTDLPGAVAALDKKLGAMKRPLPGMDKAGLEAAKTSLADLKTKWGEAQTAMQGGQWAAAVAKGDEVNTAATALMATLKMPMPAAK